MENLSLKIRDKSFLLVDSIMGDDDFIVYNSEVVLGLIDVFIMFGMLREVISFEVGRDFSEVLRSE